MQKTWKLHATALAFEYQRPDYRTPQTPQRVHELLSWVRDGEYDRIVGGEYIRRGQERPVREEAADAATHYGDRFKDLFREAGEHVNSAGQQLSDWLRNLSDDSKTPKGGPDRE